MKLIPPRPFTRGAFSKVFFELDLDKPFDIRHSLTEAIELIEEHRIKVRKVYSPYIPSLASSHEITKAILQYAKRQFRQEIKMLKSLDHKNIIKLTDYSDIHQPYMSIEIFPCDLESLMKVASLSVYDKYKVVYSLIEVLRYLHNDKNICHTDLSPRNLYFDYINNEIIIADFGMAQYANDHKPLILPQSSNSAPENFFNGPQDKQTDLWLLGHIILSLYDTNHDLENKLPPLAFLVTRIPDAIDDLLRKIIITDKVLKEIVIRCLQPRDTRLNNINEVITILNKYPTVLERMKRIYDHRTREYVTVQRDRVIVVNQCLHLFVKSIVLKYDALMETDLDETLLSDYSHMVAKMGEQYKIPFYFIHLLMCSNLMAVKGHMKDHEHSLKVEKSSREMRNMLTLLQLAEVYNGIMLLMNMTESEAHNKYYHVCYENIKDLAVDYGTIISVKTPKKLGPCRWAVKLENFIGPSQEIHDHILYDAKDYCKNRLHYTRINNIIPASEESYEIVLMDDSDVRDSSILVDAKDCELKVHWERQILRNKIKICIYSEIQGVFNITRPVFIRYEVKDINKYSAKISENEITLNRNNGFIKVISIPLDSGTMPTIKIIHYDIIKEMEKK